MSMINKTILIVCIAFLSFGCDKITELIEGEKKQEPNEIAGDVNVTIAQPGNTFSAPTVYVAGTAVSVPHTVSIVRNDAGVATINVKVPVTTLKNNSLYQQYNTKYNLDGLLAKIPATYKDASGNIDANVKMKITSEGIQDYINRDNKPHTIVKFNANVGDSYDLTKSGGQVLKRTVTQKSTADDFPYGLMNIKTITTEQVSSYPGVKKIVYKTNHKFGLVYAEVQFEDGTKLNSYVYAKNTN